MSDNIFVSYVDDTLVICIGKTWEKVIINMNNYLNQISK